MNIAICDDCVSDAALLRDMLAQMAENCAIECFTAGRDLLDAARDRRFDLVFMDVYLKGENGIDVVRELNALSPSTRAVFTTCSDAHAVEAFNVRALHYLVKPFARTDIEEALERMRTSIESRAPDSTLTVRIGNDVYTLAQMDILRVESNNHKTNIYMRNGPVYSIWVPFRRVAAQLDSFFLTISRGVAVNMHHIVKWQSANCQMTDGTVYLFSRSNRQQMKEAYYNFKQDQLIGEQTRI